MLSRGLSKGQAMKRIILAGALALAFTGAAQANKYICTHTHQIFCSKNFNNDGLRCFNNPSEPIDLVKVGVIQSEIDTKKRTYKRCVSKKGKRTCEDYKAYITCGGSATYNKPPDCGKNNRSNSLTVFTSSSLHSRMLYFSFSDYRMTYVVRETGAIILQSGLCTEQ